MIKILITVISRSKNGFFVKRGIYFCPFISLAVLTLLILMFEVYSGVAGER